MGDLPGRQSRIALELTDLIFDGPLKQVSASGREQRIMTALTGDSA